MLPSSASCAACRRPAPAWHAALPAQRPRAPLLRRATAAHRCCVLDAGLPSCSVPRTQHIGSQQAGSQPHVPREPRRHQWHAATPRQGWRFLLTASAAASSDSGGAESTDVVIVGGGLAGLAAGLALSKAGAFQIDALSALWSTARSSELQSIDSAPHLAGNLGTLKWSRAATVSPMGIKPSGEMVKLSWPSTPVTRRTGVPFVLLEASDGVGGRVRTDTVDGFTLDRGFAIFLTSYPETQVLPVAACRVWQSPHPSSKHSMPASLLTP